MEELCDLKVHINGQHTFLLNQRIICEFSGRLRKMAKQCSKIKSPGLKLMEFPGGPDGFELVSRFCYGGGRIPMTTSNISILYCSAIVLEMTEEVSKCNLLGQAETFLDGLYYWTWDDILTALKNCEPFLSTADSSGLVQKLVTSLLAKISANSGIQLAAALTASSSSSSSPDSSGFRSCSSKTSDPVKPCSSREWWFDGLAILSPAIIEKIMRSLGAYGADNKNLILTRFLLHYLKRAAHRPSCFGSGSFGYRAAYGGLADTAVHGVVLIGSTAFSCRGLFWVLRVLSGLGMSRECRNKLERLMGLVLDQATLDDLLVSGYNGGVYDVDLVLSLLRVFVSGEEGEVSSQRMKKVGRLVDKYLREISPDQSLKASKFLSVAESLPDSARDCYDGVYRALDIYLESHQSLSTEERIRLCSCLNYGKLTLEGCKDLAKNQRVPPEIAIKALVSQQPKLRSNTSMADNMTPKVIVHTSPFQAKEQQGPLDDKEDIRLRLQKMQNRVKELEKMQEEMKSHMSKVGRSKFITIPVQHSSRGMPRMC